MNSGISTVRTISIPFEKKRKKLYVACQCNMLDYAKNKLIIKDRSTKDINMIILFVWLFFLDLKSKIVTIKYVSRMKFCCVMSC